MGARERRRKPTPKKRRRVLLHCKGEGAKRQNQPPPFSSYLSVLLFPPCQEEFLPSVSPSLCDENSILVFFFLAAENAALGIQI